MSVSTNNLKQGMKVEIDRDPYNIVGLEFVKPGKGQAFTRVKMRNLVNKRVVEKTYKSNEKLQLADVQETKMRLLYTDEHDATFMDDQTFEQVTIPLSDLDDKKIWLLEDVLYDIVFYKGQAIDLIPPTFMELKVTDTAPGVRGDTASGRVVKDAILQTGAKIQIPIFIEQDEVIKVDTRTGSYVSRV
ncbi:MAG: Elongation factor P [Chlamydiae bacterium]|nr:Elongation factor P [Chlamydiota bacterium]